MMHKPIFTFLVISILFMSCAPARFVKPLDDKQKAINLSVGGPVIDYSDVPIPMPFLTATYGYGFDSTMTGFGSLNITSLLYGNIQVELGVTEQLLKQKGLLPGLSFNPVVNIIYRNKDAVKIYPQLDVNAFWDFNQNRNFVYIGFSNWFELSGKKAHDQEQEKHWLISPMIGQTFVRKKWNYNIELKLITPGIQNNNSPVEYKSPFGNNGAVGIYFGCTRKF